MKIYVAGIVYGSMVDGNGLRTTIFLSGCNVGCKGCHNNKFKNIESGKAFEIKRLIETVKENTPQKKITISGGEPMEQKHAVMELINILKSDNYDIGLYTSFELCDINKSLISNLSFIKTGKYEQRKKVYGQYYGSSNQEMHYMGGDECRQK